MIEKIISKLAEGSKELLGENAKDKANEKLQMVETTGSMAKINQIGESNELLRENAGKTGDPESKIKNQPSATNESDRLDKQHNKLSKLDPLETENILFKPSDKNKLTFKGGLGICGMKCLSTGCVGAMGALSNPKPISHSVGKAH